MEMMFKFDLGDKVKERITGFEGVVVCQSRYLTGCNRYAVQSQELRDGKPADWVYFDEDMLVINGQNINIRPYPKTNRVNMEAPQR